jgi:hypothetical protein
MVYNPLRRYITIQKHPGQSQSNQKTDLGLLHHFLGTHVTRDSRGLFLSQQQYILDLIQKDGMTDYQPSRALVDTSSKLSATVNHFLMLPFIVVSLVHGHQGQQQFLG